MAIPITVIYLIVASLLKESLYSDREFKHKAPDYVLEALLVISRGVETTCPHETIFHNNGTPFMNHGDERKTSAFHVQAYCWDDKLYQFYNFKWRNFKVLWYKHCQRSTTISRPMGEAECAVMLSECLKSLEVK